VPKVKRSMKKLVKSPVKKASKGKGKAKKPKASPEEELGLTGTETVDELYSMYVKAKSGTNEKLIEKIRGVWKKKYYESR
jgi:hypothetical protein